MELREPICSCSGTYETVPIGGHPKETLKNCTLKRLARKLYFREGKVRRIRLGPMRGFVFRVSDITGLSPWYSGAEREHQRTFKRLVQAGDVVVDVGANWGLHTLYLSRLVREQGMVISIEPFPPVFAELQWHTQANDCSNVKQLCAAVSDTDGEALLAPGDDASTGRLSGAADSSAFEGESFIVKTHRLDSILNDLEIEAPRMIKY